MGYNSSTGILSRPVSIDDIKIAINYPSTGSHNLADIASCALVNKWAKYKSINNQGPGTAIQDSDNYRGEAHLTTVRSCGFRMAPSTSISTALSRAKNLTDWDYIYRSDGPTFPHRCDDFNGYYHAARSWMRGFSCNEGSEAYAGESDIEFTVNLETGSSSKELRASDIIVDSDASRKTLDKWLIGMLFEEVARTDGLEALSPRVCEGLKITADMSSILNTGGMRMSRTFDIYPVYIRNGIPTTDNINSIESGFASEIYSSQRIIPMALQPVRLKLYPALGEITFQSVEYDTSTNRLAFDFTIANRRNDDMKFTLADSGTTNLWIEIRLYSSAEAANADDGTGNSYLYTEVCPGSIEMNKLTQTGIYKASVDSSGTYTIEKGGSIALAYHTEGLNFTYVDWTLITHMKMFGRFAYEDSSGTRHTTNNFTQLSDAIYK